MESDRTDEDWKTCFAQLSPALLLFARRWTNLPGRCRGYRAGSVRPFLAERTFDRKPRPPLRDRPLRPRSIACAASSAASRREAAVARDGADHFEPQFTTDDEGQQMLAAAVERLPNEQREVVILKIWNELTFAEIAGILEISQNTAASRYRYALGALKKTLQPHE